MAESSTLYRRSFVQNASLGFGAGVVGVAKRASSSAAARPKGHGSSQLDAYALGGGKGASCGRGS
jgi:hypothetical protein